jgi:hypothetical protein
MDVRPMSTEAIKHTLPDLLRQRIFGLTRGSEDVIDGPDRDAKIILRFCDKA